MEGRFQLESAFNRNGKQTDQVPYGLDLSFLSPNPKKPYEAPKLTVYGTVRELTLKVGRRGKPDAGRAPRNTTAI